MRSLCCRQGRRIPVIATCCGNLQDELLQDTTEGQALRDLWRSGVPNARPLDRSWIICTDVHSVHWCAHSLHFCFGTFWNRIRGDRGRPVCLYRIRHDMCTVSLVCPGNCPYWIRRPWSCLRHLKNAWWPTIRTIQILHDTPRRSKKNFWTLRHIGDTRENMSVQGLCILLTLVIFALSRPTFAWFCSSGWYGSTDTKNTEYTVGDSAKNGKAIYPGDLKGVAATQ